MASNSKNNVDGSQNVLIENRKSDIEDFSEFTSKESALNMLLMKGGSPRSQSHLSDHLKIHSERGSSAVVSNLIKKAGRKKRNEAIFNTTHCPEKYLRGKIVKVVF